MVMGLLLVTVSGAAQASAPPSGAPPAIPAGRVVPKGWLPRIVPSKPRNTSIPAGYSHRWIDVKFAEGTDVSIPGTGRFNSALGLDLSGVTAALPTASRNAMFPLFDQPKASLRRQQVRLEARSHRILADLSLWYRLEVPAGSDAASMIDALDAQTIDKVAQAAPLPRVSPVTPDYQGQQGYRSAAPAGIDAGFAAGVPGGKGELLWVFDLEYSWNTSHEDLSKARAAGALILNGTPSTAFSDDHGTAVLGELVGDENGFGVTGIVPNTTIRLVNTNTTQGWNIPNAVNLARLNGGPGDVILLEQQLAGPGRRLRQRPGRLCRRRVEHTHLRRDRHCDRGRAHRGGGGRERSAGPGEHLTLRESVPWRTR